MKLMKSISESPIKESLQHVTIGNCGITKKVGEDILNDVGLDNVTIKR